MIGKIELILEGLKKIHEFKVVNDPDKSVVKISDLKSSNDKEVFKDTTQKPKVEVSNNNPTNKGNGINVDRIFPENKDFMRARNLNIASDASKMAKLITDLEKLVRRSKAIASVWRDKGSGRFYDFWDPFEQALYHAGFTKEDIEKIKNYKF